MSCIYVYYRIDPAQASLAASRIDALLQAMAVHCGRAPRRLSRCDDPSTWMEIYEGIAEPGPFSEQLSLTAEGLDCAAFIQGERHLECFTTPPPGA